MPKNYYLSCEKCDRITKQEVSDKNNVQKIKCTVCKSEVELVIKAKNVNVFKWLYEAYERRRSKGYKEKS